MSFKGIVLKQVLVERINKAFDKGIMRLGYDNGIFNLSFWIAQRQTGLNGPVRSYQFQPTPNSDEVTLTLEYEGSKLNVEDSSVWNGPHFAELKKGPTLNVRVTFKNHAQAEALYDYLAQDPHYHNGRLREEPTTPTRPPETVVVGMPGIKRLPVLKVKVLVPWGFTGIKTQNHPMGLELDMKPPTLKFGCYMHDYGPREVFIFGAGQNLGGVDVKYLSYPPDQIGLQVDFDSSAVGLAVGGQRVYLNSTLELFRNSGVRLYICGEQYLVQQFFEKFKELRKTLPTSWKPQIDCAPATPTPSSSVGTDFGIPTGFRRSTFQAEVRPGRPLNQMRTTPSQPATTHGSSPLTDTTSFMHSGSSPLAQQEIQPAFESPSGPSNGHGGLPRFAESPVQSQYSVRFSQIPTDGSITKEQFTEIAWSGFQERNITGTVADELLQKLMVTNTSQWEELVDFARLRCEKDRQNVPSQGQPSQRQGTHGFRGDSVQQDMSQTEAGATPPRVPPSGFPGTNEQGPRQDGNNLVYWSGDHGPDQMVPANGPQASAAPSNSLPAGTPQQRHASGGQMTPLIRSPPPQNHQRHHTVSYETHPPFVQHQQQPNSNATRSTVPNSFSNTGSGIQNFGIMNHFPNVIGNPNAPPAAQGPVNSGNGTQIILGDGASFNAVPATQNHIQNFTTNIFNASDGINLGFGFGGMGFNAGMSATSGMTDSSFGFPFAAGLSAGASPKAIEAPLNPNELYLLDCKILANHTATPILPETERGVYIIIELDRPYKLRMKARGNRITTRGLSGVNVEHHNGKVTVTFPGHNIESSSGSLLHHGTSVCIQGEVARTVDAQRFMSEWHRLSGNGSSGGRFFLLE